MRAIVQHNFTTGFGDALNCIYEYYKTTEKLRILGYTVDIHFNLNRNVYFEKNKFFDYFDIKFFESHFDNVVIRENPINEVNYENLVRVHSIGTAEPGGHLWDLFLEKTYNQSDLESIYCFSYIVPDYLEYLPVFSENLMSKYDNIKKQYNLDDPYYSIYYRTLDLQDNEGSYQQFEEKISEILRTNQKVFVCSNSFRFKEFVKSKGDGNVITYNIPMEKDEGNHFNYNRVFFNDTQTLHDRTEYVIFEMLTLSDSYGVEFFSLWNRPSNFLLLANIKRVNINNNLTSYQD